MAKPRALKLRYLDDGGTAATAASAAAAEAEAFDEYRRGSVRFGTVREPRGDLRIAPHLRWFPTNSEYEFFAELQTLSQPHESVLRVRALSSEEEAGGDLFYVFLNGRRIRANEEASVMDGDILRIGERRFGIGDELRFPRNDVEKAFLSAIQERPGDDDARLVYADWLEERGDFAHAELLRLELQIRHKDDPSHASHASHDVKNAKNVKKMTNRRFVDLTARFQTAAEDVASLAWRTLVARPLIERCDVKMELECPKRWENLSPTAQADVRHCSACKKNVILCTDTAQARTIAARGGCVAIELGVPRFPRDLDQRQMRVGRVLPTQTSKR
jgi:uncharacterized protein (TIGR02996 family)